MNKNITFLSNDSGKNSNSKDIPLRKFLSFGKFWKKNKTCCTFIWYPRVHTYFALNLTLRPLDQNYSSNDEYDMLLEDNLLHTRQYSLYGNSQATAAS